MVNAIIQKTWNIPEGFSQTSILVVDYARPFALDTSTIPHLTLARTHALGGVYLTTQRKLDHCPTTQ